MAIKSRNDLRYDHSICESLAKQHQLVRQRGAAHERNTGVDHAREEISRLFNEFSRGPIGGHHDHGSYRNAALFELLDSVVHVDGVALVIEAQDRVVIAAERANSL